MSGYAVNYRRRTPQENLTWAGTQGSPQPASSRFGLGLGSDNFDIANPTANTDNRRFAMGGNSNTSDPVNTQPALSTRPSLSNDPRFAPTLATMTPSSGEVVNAGGGGGTGGSVSGSDETTQASSNFESRMKQGALSVINRPITIKRMEPDSVELDAEACSCKCIAELAANTEVSSDIFNQCPDETTDIQVFNLSPGVLVHKRAEPNISSHGEEGESGPAITGTVTTADIVRIPEISGGVHKSIADNVRRLLDHAKRDGVRLTGGGWRSTDQQIKLRIAHCGGNTPYNINEKPSRECHPPTARPGRSQHEKGLAIDFQYNGRGITDHSNVGFRWLAANALQYGFKNLPSEPWHWSTTGR